ncbi:MAG TPA: hypothetical protein VGG20_29760 [Thermoanaerobaculia bacterium]|jgi:hypothetical protein
MKHAVCLVSAVAIVLGLPWALPASAAPLSREVSWCGTNRFGVVISDAVHRQHERRLTRERARLGKAATVPRASSSGNVAVVADDGGIIVPAQPFNLTGLRFTSSARGVHVDAEGADFDSEIGGKVTLGDDASLPVTFASGFTFSFFGHTYSSLYLNSDGNLTFEEPEERSNREIPDFLSGPPRIAPFFADLDPSVTVGDAGVYLRTAADRVVVTWLRVPLNGDVQSNTFQATLFADGRVTFAYQAVAAKEAVVGISPGRNSQLDLIDFATELPAATRKVAVAQRFGASSYVDEFRIGEAFFAHFADVYDHVIVFVDFPLDLSGGFAYELSARNDVSGLGQDLFDYSSLFGSQGRLRAFVMMSSLAHFPADPDEEFLATNSTLDVMGQEAGHRWLARMQFKDENGKPSNALLGRDLAHWSFKHSTLASDMEGNEIRDNGDGTFVTTDATERYSPLDQYAMGLIPASAVPPFFYVSGGTSESIQPGRHPEIGVSFTGQRHDVTIDDIIAVEGERQPSSDVAPKTFKMAFVLIEPVGKSPSRASLAKVDRIRRRWESYFHTATDLHGTVDTRLRRR